MPKKALVIELGSNLSHGRKVISNFKSVSNWDAEMLVHTLNEDIANEPDVVATVWRSTSPCGVNNNAWAIMCWLDDNIQNYDLVIFSYVTDGYYTGKMSAVIDKHGKPLFMPMDNNNTLDATYHHSNIIFSGGGTTSNDRGKGNKIWFWDEGVNTTLTSFTSAIAAGKYANLIDSGLTVAEAMRAMTRDDWDATNGFGKANSTPNNTLQPINALRAEKSGSNLRLHYTVFHGDEIDSVNIYVDGVLYFNGNGEKKITNGGWGVQYFLQASVHYTLTFPISDFEEGEMEFSISAVRGQEESIIRDYAKATVTITHPEPEPDPVDVEPIITSFSREGSEVILITSNNQIGNIYRKERINDEFELIGITETEIYIDTVDETKNYIYALKITNGVNITDYSPSVFVLGEVKEVSSTMVY